MAIHPPLVSDINSPKWPTALDNSLVVFAAVRILMDSRRVYERQVTGWMKKIKVYNPAITRNTDMKMILIIRITLNAGY